MVNKLPSAGSASCPNSTESILVSIIRHIDVQLTEYHRQVLLIVSSTRRIRGVIKYIPWRPSWSVRLGFVPY
jgi:hypothetical protein